MQQLKNFTCPITPLSHELHNIVIGGEGVGTRRNGVNAEKTTFFHNSLSVPGTFVDYCTDEIRFQH